MSGNFYYSRIRYEYTDTGAMKVAFVRTVPYRGSWASCKGDDTAKQAEQQQLNFNNQLMNIFNQQYAMQSAVLNFLKNRLQPMIENPQGYSDQTLAAMRTSATDTLSGEYQNAQKTLQNNLNQRNGGSDLPSGSEDQLQATLLQNEATDKANAQNTITLNNENLKQSNLWNAFNILSGNVAQQFNPIGYASAANQGGDTVANLSNAVANSKKGFWSSFANSLGQGFGNLVTGGNSTGGSGVGAWFGACWVAASLFGGWNSYKTRLCRFWLKNIAPAWLRNFYIRFGERISKTPLRWGFYPVFQYALRIS